MQTFADFEQRPYRTVPCQNKYSITVLKIDNATREKTVEKNAYYKIMCVGLLLHKRRID